MDYDLTDIPAAYDRSRDHGPELVGLWMDVVARHVDTEKVRRILDLGCGTGRFTGALAWRFAADVVGLDPSAKMLARARAKGAAAGVRYLRGRAEAIPLATASVDVVFMSMSFHHFAGRASAARECRRVLREHGSALVRTGTRERISSYPYVPFFERTRAMIDELLPDRATLSNVFETAGLRMSASEIVLQAIAPDWAAYVEKVAARGDSVLARLDDEEFATGLAALRSRTSPAVTEPVVEPIDFFVFRHV